MYVPEDHYLWDFWFAPHRPGEPFHLFYLKATRSLSHPEERHLAAAIGHAVSDNLITWRYAGTALAAGEPGAWDDRCLWTGCCIEHDGLFYLFYTGLSRRDLGLVQRIGLATSSDLVDWRRHPANPVLTADPRWYETAVGDPAGDEAWRDPFVFYDPKQGVWLMLICARVSKGEPDGRGVVGLARSADLVNWETLPPLETTRDFGQLEVPQLVQLNGHSYLVFCTGEHAAARLARTGPAGNWCGTHYLVADRPLGKYRLLDEGPLLAEPDCRYYAGRIETELTGDPLLLAWRGYETDSSFTGGLSNPVPVRVAAGGRLSIDSGRLWD